MKKVLIFVGVGIILALNASVVSACMCSTVGTPTSNLARSQAVFLGKIVEAKPHEWTFAVNKVWKGNVEEKVLMVDPSAGSDCESRFRLGETYIVFAHVKESDGKVIYTPAPCTWIVSMTYIYNGELVSKYILKELNEGKPALMKLLNKKVNSKDEQ